MLSEGRELTVDFRELLKSDEYSILDGGFGTELQKRGLKLGEVPEEMNFARPEWVVDILSSYESAGSKVVCANTFGANRFKLKKTGRSVVETVGQAVKVAKSAVKEAAVALDVGPLGQLIEPAGTMTFDEAYDAFREIVIAGDDAGADVIFFETMTDLYEMKAALLAAKENTTLPVVCSMTLEENMRTFSGNSVTEEVLVLEGLGADAVGLNCSLGPAEMVPAVEKLLELATVPVFIKPNAGLPDPVTGCYSLDADGFAEGMKKFADMGVKLLGGCCGTSPEYIRLMTEKIGDMKCPPPRGRKISALTSGSRTVRTDRPAIIGERINPTGKKLFKEALKRGDIDYILSKAVEQVTAGAEILDINVGLPEIDEKEMMVRVVKAVQSITDVPLQLDTTDPDALEAGLRIYNGKAMVNSVNGKEESLSAVLPLVKKYGAAVVGLTLDENGIPPEAAERVAIAEKIMTRAQEYGIPKEDIYIDCLTLTVSAEQKAAGETLKALRTVKEKLGLKTVLGVSNISFGLPDRECINRTFLSMALEAGLDLPIINPNVDSMTDAVRAFRVLRGYDENAADYIASRTEPSDKGEKKTSPVITLAEAVEKGLKAEAAKLTEELLENASPLDVINCHLIPILDEVGVKYEKGILYLPQLILAADTAGVCFGAVKAKLASENTGGVSRGKIILATVEGDVHDIGKNIVKVILENYGYNVIDLGKDVPCRTVVEATLREKAPLVGLSALMTTTLPSMEKTIRLLREAGADCKVMVGGAVLTPEYAEKIGADYYSKDAKESADIAKKVFGDA